MIDNVLVSIYNTDGTPKVDAVPAFVDCRDIGGIVQPFPVITSLGNGDYSFFLPGDAGYLIETYALPEYLGGGVGNGVWFNCYEDDGSPKSDATPVVTVYDWDGNLISTISAINKGIGLYWFGTVGTGIFKVETGCNPSYLDGDFNTGITPAPVPPVSYGTTVGAAGVGRDIWCDFVTGKFYQNKGDLVLSTGKPAIQQALNIALNTWARTYYLDTTVGVDYFGKVLVRNPSQALINSELRRVIMSVLGVISVQSVSYSINSLRQATFKYQITTDVGLLSGSVTGG
jgi:hypothetical protein